MATQNFNDWYNDLNLQGDERLTPLPENLPSDIESDRVITQINKTGKTVKAIEQDTNTLLSKVKGTTFTEDSSIPDPLPNNWKEKYTIVIFRQE